MILPWGDYFLLVLKFDISADLQQNAKFNTRKNLNKPLRYRGGATHARLRSAHACTHTHYYVQGLLESCGPKEAK